VTEARPRRSALAWAIPAGLVVVAAIVAAVVVTQDPGQAPAPAPTTTTAPEPEAVEISSDAPSFTSLDQLVEASDLIVRGRVTDTERGRWFGDGSTSSRIQSRLVTLDVEEVIAGNVPSGELGSLLLEEEGWLEAGAPLVVDGAAPSAVGDEGIWFLVDPGDDTTDALIVVNAQGRYLLDGDHVTGAEGGDALVTDLTGGSLDGLAGRIRSAASRP
jgi:hypothetical protein